MRTLKKFLAGILVCALAILPLAGCSGAPADGVDPVKARQNIIKALNEKGLEVETWELSLTSVENQTLAEFSKLNSTIVPNSVYSGAYQDAWVDAKKSYEDLFYSSIEARGVLGLKVDNTNAELLYEYKDDAYALADQIQEEDLQAILDRCPAFSAKKIGIGLVTVQGKTYWTVRIYA